MSGHGPNAAAVRKLIDRILDRWPNQKKTAAQVRDYAADIRTLVERFGFNRVQAAADEARIRKSFLPEPAELFELLPPVPDSAKPKPAKPDPNCRDCSGSGWKNVPGPDRRVTRCHCKEPAVAPKPTFAPDIEPLHTVLKQAVERMKTMDPAPASDPKRHAELEERIARDAAEKEARRQRTKEAAAIRDILPSLQIETGDDPECEMVQ
jgi:hypothetical protein